jgi:hypothetical protein
MGLPIWLSEGYQSYFGGDTIGRAKSKYQRAKIKSKNSKMPVKAGVFVVHIKLQKNILQ